MKKAIIDYGYGIATLWGDFTDETVERFFMQHANQCYGIRKSIMHVKVQFIEDAEMPEFYAKLGATVLLKHSGDSIAWGPNGEKIKSEWD